MKKSRYTEDGMDASRVLMVALLREAENTSAAAVARKNKVGEQTIDCWRQHFSRLEPSDVKATDAF